MVLLNRWPNVGEISFKNRRDFATQVDLDIESNIKSALSSQFPDHGLSGEETGGQNPGSEYQWLIDPIDGTKYYAAQSSLFSVSVGLLYRGEPVLGVVYAPTSDQCFYACSGSGAFLDGHRLSGPHVAEVSDVIANVDTPNTHNLSAAEREWFERKLILLTRNFYRIRALGLGSLSACWLATGALDAYIDLTGYVKPQDLAAGRVILKEAGLRLEYLDAGVGPPKLLAAPKAIWEPLKSLLLE